MPYKAADIYVYIVQALVITTNYKHTRNHEYHEFHDWQKSTYLSL